MLKKKKEKINPMKVLKERRDALEEMQKTLEDKGVHFYVPNKELNINEEYLSIPANITDVPARELGELLNAYTQHKVYMRTLLGWAEMELERARREYYRRSQSLYSQMSNSKLAEKAKERLITCDPSVIDYYEDFVTKQEAKNLLLYNIESIEDIIFMLSREISRRGNDFENESRNIHANNKYR